MSKKYNFEITREDAVLINSAVQTYVANAKRAYADKKISSECYCELLTTSIDFLDRFRTVAEQIHEDMVAREVEKNG